MHIFLGVENFAKIESARVCIDSYTLMVGPNNSGKTFLMQLIQGASDRIISLIDEEVLPILRQEGDTFSGIIENLGAEYTRYVISQHNILQFTAYLNEKINMKKEQIVREIFGKEIAIGRLYIEISLSAEENYEIIISNDVKKMEEYAYTLINLDMQDIHFGGHRIGVLTQYDSEKNKSRFLFVSMGMNENDLGTVMLHLSSVLGCKSLYLPASRTGLMLLYREFFANKVDDMLYYEMKEHKFVENKAYFGNLTEPIYQFLRFLQTHVESERKNEEYKNEISFFEKHLIEGHISTDKQNGFLYYSVLDDRNVPMHMASSMINEIAPIIMSLTDSQAFERLIIDEIEASLHPQKQLELVRFLNRLSNKGIRLILSTHSDTFASKVNNLYLLSEYVRQNKEYETINKMGLEKEDLINTGRLFVYEFISQSNGQSTVKEIAADRTTGFQFDLFTDSAMHLYSESLKIGEILQNDKTEF